MRQDLRRHKRQLPSARRGDRLPDLGPYGAGMEHALRSGRQARELRLDRGSPPRGDAIHRSASFGDGDGPVGRPESRHRRLRSQLRRAEHGTDGSPVESAEPSGQRRQRDRRRDGDERPAPQPGRNLRRHHRRDRRSRRLAVRASEDLPGSRLPDRRDHLRYQRDPPRLPAGAGERGRPRPRQD